MSGLRHTSQGLARRPNISVGQAKLFTFIALAVSIYWQDIRNLSKAVMLGDEWLGAATLMSFAGMFLILRRKAIDEVLDLERPRQKEGILLILLSFSLYASGSYFGSAIGIVLHILSLSCFLCSYCLLRMNELLVRTFFPLVIIIMFVSLLVSNELTKDLTPALSASIAGSLGLLLWNLDRILIIFLISLNLLFLLVCQTITSSIAPVYAPLLLVSLSYIESAIAFAGRRAYSAKGSYEVFVTPCPICSEIQQQSTAGDFCPSCGRNLIGRRTRSSLEVTGLVLALIFVVFMEFVSVPVLMLDNKGLTFVEISPLGLATKEMPSVPAHWMEYSSNRMFDLEQEFSEDLILSEVIVPEQYPEQKNYTVLIEISYASPRISDKWRFSPKPRISQEILFGGSIEARYYEVSNGSMLVRVATWKERITLFSQGVFQVRIIGFSVFSNSSLSSQTSAEDMSGFLRNVEEMSLVWMEPIRRASGWYSILASVLLFFDRAKDYVLIAMTTLGIWAATSLALPSDRTPEPYLIDLRSPEESSALAAINRISKSGSTVTGHNILVVMRKDLDYMEVDIRRVLAILESLEQMHLVKRSIRLLEQEWIMEWRLNF